MPDWQHKVRTVKGKWTRGPVNASDIEEALAAEEQGGWELVAAVPVAQLGFTSAIWLFFKRPFSPGAPGPRAPMPPAHS